jgi:beta-galactosidase
VDFVMPGDDFNSYRLVVAPHLHILTSDTIATLVSFVRNGGHLLLGPRSGFKDEHNALLPSRQPGRELADLLGAEVAEFYALGQPVPVDIGHARIWAEYLIANSPACEVLFRYGKSNGWLDRQPACISKIAGKGRISYLGAWLDDATMAKFIPRVLKLAGIPSTSLPAGIELCRRGERRIVINHGKQARTVKLAGKSIRIPAGDVVIS